MDSNISFDMDTDKHLLSIYNMHKAAFDFAYATMEFYGDKLETARQNGATPEEIEALEKATWIWAVSANVLRAPVLAITGGASENLEELCNFSEEFSKRCIEKIKKQVHEDLMSLINN